MEAGADPLIIDASTGKKPATLANKLLRPLTKLFYEHERLPRVNLGAPFTKADVVGDSVENSPLQNPITWRNINKINAVLAEQGEKLGKDELFLPPAEGSQPPVATLQKNHLLPLVMNRLMDSGERIHVSDFENLPKNSDVLGDKRVLGAIFSQKNADLGGIKELKEDYRALTPLLRGRVDNFHSLCASMGKSKSMER